MRTLILIVAFVVLTGCAGTPFQFDEARKVKVGMTESEVIGLMGRPYMVSSSNGQQVWIWSHASVFSQAKSVSMIFRNGKVVSVPDIPTSFK